MNIEHIIILWVYILSMNTFIGVGVVNVATNFEGTWYKSKRLLLRNIIWAIFWAPWLLGYCVKNMAIALGKAPRQLYRFWKNLPD